MGIAAGVMMPASIVSPPTSPNLSAAEGGEERDGTYLQLSSYCVAFAAAAAGGSSST